MRFERGFVMHVHCTFSSWVLPALALSLLAACGGASSAPAPESAHGGPLTEAARASKTAGAPADPLGPRPEVRTPSPFRPPVPVVYTRPNGTKVWLLERHGLPLVSVQVVVPAGSREDPKDAGGLAWVTANMLDEGAGPRSAIRIAEDVDRLGATLRTGALSDYAFVELTSLKKNLEPALAIFGDVLAKPTFPEAEWKRVHALWQNDLRARSSDPNAVARVVSARKLFPSGHPYAHPVNGTLGSSAKITLPMVKAFHASSWRPERASVVVVGDVTRAEVDAMLDRALGAWKGTGGASAATAATAATPPPPPAFESGPSRVVVVDRPDAPQSVIAIVRPGVAASSPDAAGLVRVNGALGGSFTSRLNQDLREEHGWSYGAHSRLSFSALPGMFSAEAAVHTEHTGEALRAALGDIASLAKSGLTDEELEKTKLLARGDLVEAYEGVSGAAARLGRNAGLGLRETSELDMAVRTYDAKKGDLDALAAKYLDMSHAVVVIVGPKSALEPQLRAAGMTNIETSGPEGE